jgi:hypothetical protein
MPKWIDFREARQTRPLQRAPGPGPTVASARILARAGQLRRRPAHECFCHVMTEGRLPDARFFPGRRDPSTLIPTTCSAGSSG